MRIDFSHNYAEVSKRDNGTFFVKLHFPEVGLYVNGIRVVPSKKNSGELLVYKPAILNANGAYKSNYDYENSSELWLYFKELALKAVDDYDATQVFNDEPIDLDSIDFEQNLSDALDKFGIEEKGGSL
jgi:hypothetical protein